MLRYTIKGKRIERNEDNEITYLSFSNAKLELTEKEYARLQTHGKLYKAQRKIVTKEQIKKKKEDDRIEKKALDKYKNLKYMVEKNHKPCPEKGRFKYELWRHNPKGYYNFAMYFDDLEKKDEYIKQDKINQYKLEKTKRKQIIEDDEV